MATWGRMTRTAAAASVAAMLLAGCAAAAESDPLPPAGDAAAQETTAGTDGATLLAEHGLDGLSGKELVEQLDRSPDARPLAVLASVRPDEVLVSDGTVEVAVPLPDDEFYLSIAPYVTSTHDCWFHNLGTCQGELAGADVGVTITADDGTVLVDETATTYANGFVGFWLPQGLTGTVELVHDGLTSTAPFSTADAEDPTCVTTMRLA